MVLHYRMEWPGIVVPDQINASDKILETSVQYKTTVHRGTHEKWVSPLYFSTSYFPGKLLYFKVYFFKQTQQSFSGDVLTYEFSENYNSNKEIIQRGKKLRNFYPRIRIA
jgi:hypothetical protein